MGLGVFSQHVRVVVSILPLGNIPFGITMPHRLVKVAFGVLRSEGLGLGSIFFGGE